jgi:hypothetical protein
MTEIKGIHPLAEIFEMLSEADLADLAADIKAHGQKLPILVVDGGILIDGRNRLRACEIAEVEPLVRTLDPSEIPDPLAFVISINAKRRKSNAGQLAMAAAEAWHIAEKDGKVQTKGGNRKSKAQSGHLISEPRDYFAKAFGVGKNYVEQARALLKDDALGAAAVKAGGSLKDYYEALTKRAGSTVNEQIRRRRLGEQRPDLVEQVEAGTTTLEAAEALAKQEADELKQRRWALTMNLIDSVGAFDRAPGDATDVAAAYDPVHADGRGEKITPERLRRVSAFAAALADAMEGEPR